MAAPLTLDALQVLDAIARRGSFAGAADELDRVTSAVSYTIQKLEEEMDVLLFDRSGHRAELTPAGRLVLERGRELLEGATQLVEEARALESGWESRLTIALDAIYPEQKLLPLLQRFDELGAATELRVTSEVLMGPWDALESGRADIAIATDQFRLPRPFRSRAIAQTRFVYVAAPEHPIFRDGPQPDMHKYRAIAIADTSRSRLPRSTRLGPRQSTLTFSHFPAKVAALVAGIGIGALPLAWAEPELATGRLRLIDHPDNDSVVTLNMVWHSGRTGKAKRWLLRELPALFAANKPLQEKHAKTRPG